MHAFRSSGFLRALNRASACLLISTTFAVAADARSVTYQLDIPAQSLDGALQALALASHHKLFYEAGLVKGKQSPALKGKFTAEEGLRGLLSGTDLRYEVTEDGLLLIRTPGDGASNHPARDVSIERTRWAQPESTFSGAAPLPAPVTERGNESIGQQLEQIAELVVTARKREETLLSVPQTVNVISSETIENYNVQSFQDYAAMVPNLAFSFGAGTGNAMSNSRAILLRGVSGRNTTNVYVDDTQVDQTHDPRIVDVERIEVLKGPQGTLFGAGSIGGTLRILTKQPNLHENSLGVGGEGGFTKGGSGADFSVNAKGNVVIIPDRMAVRSMAFVNRESGFVTRTYRLYRDDPNSERVSVDGQGRLAQYGGSVTALLQPVDNFYVTARLMGQWSDLYGYPAVFRGRKNFDPESLTYDRIFNLQDTQDAHWLLPSLKLAYHGPWYEVVSSTSYFRRRSQDSWDMSEPVAQIVARPPYNSPNYSQPVLDGNTYRSDTFQQELRVSTDPWHNLSAAFGAFYSSRKTDSVYNPRVVPGLRALGGISDLYYTATYTDKTRESAVFGELYYNIKDVVKLTAGVRRFELDLRTLQVDEGAVVNRMNFVTTTRRASETGISPKFSVSVEPTNDVTVYGTAAKGFRVGGPGRLLIPGCAAELAQLGLTREEVEKGYGSDSVWSYESGVKVASMDKRMFTTLAVFQTDWKGIQQSVRLASCAASFTGNAGAARIRGAEMEVNGSPARGLGIRAGVGYADAVITDNNDGRTAQAVGSRVYNSPRLTASAGFHYTRAIGAGREAFVSSDWSYVGDSLSANSNTASPQIRGAYAMGNVRVGTRWGSSEVSLFVDNVTNERANLGDLAVAANWSTVINGQTVENAKVVVSRPLHMGVQFKREF
ncbi:MAG: TonB-dependent receptor [Steroidobacteraceae bacterium]